MEMRGNPLPLTVRVQNAIMYLRGNMFMLHSGKDIKVFFLLGRGVNKSPTIFVLIIFLYSKEKLFHMCGDKNFNLIQNI